MNERLKNVRKALNLTQTAFSSKLGIRPNTLSQYETGVTHIPDSIVVSTCREFGVNEIWLRTGEGEMFRPMSAEEEIAAFVGDIISDPDSEFQRRFIRAMAKLTTEQWKLVEDMVRTLTEEEKEKSPE